MRITMSIQDSEVRECSYENIFLTDGFSKPVVRLMSMLPQVPEPAGAFWGCVVVAAAVVLGSVAMAHQSGKIANHMTTTMEIQGERITNTCEKITNTSEQLLVALVHHSDRIAATGERIASLAEAYDIHVNFKLSVQD